MLFGSVVVVVADVEVGRKHREVGVAPGVAVVGAALAEQADEYDFLGQEVTEYGDDFFGEAAVGEDELVETFVLIAADTIRSEASEDVLSVLLGPILAEGLHAVAERLATEERPWLVLQILAALRELGIVETEEAPQCALNGLRELHGLVVHDVGDPFGKRVLARAGRTGDENQVGHFASSISPQDLLLWEISNAMVKGSGYGIGMWITSRIRRKSSGVRAIEPASRAT